MVLILWVILNLNPVLQVAKCQLLQDRKAAQVRYIQSAIAFETPSQQGHMGAGQIMCHLLSLAQRTEKVCTPKCKIILRSILQDNLSCLFVVHCVYS